MYDSAQYDFLNIIFAYILNYLMYENYYLLIKILDFYINPIILYIVLNYADFNKNKIDNFFLN